MSECRQDLVVNEVQVGRRFRALRHRLGWRQRDLAVQAGLSQSVVSFIERGRIDRVSFEALRRVATVLEAEVVVFLRWRGGDLDRLVDEGHAALGGTMVAILRRHGWHLKVEVSYSEFGERGSIDILAWHQATRSLLIIEIKTELVSVEAMLRKQDEKARLAPKVAREQFGWDSRTTSRLLVLPDLSTQRRRVERHDAVLRAACPTRGTAVRRWLRAPIEPISGLAFIQPTVNGRMSRKRIRCKRAA